MHDASFLKSLSPEKRETLLTELRKALSGEYGHIGFDGRRIAKATDVVGVTTDLQTLPVPLEAPAQLLYPVLTPLRNMIPRKVQGGPAITFRQILGINTKKTWGSVPEASATASGRNSHIAFTEKNATTNFKTIEQENFVTPEAEFGGNWNGQNFNNREFATLACLQSTFLAEELVMLGGNEDPLGAVTSASIRLSTRQEAAGGGALTDGTAYFVTIAPVTLQGYSSGAKGQVGGVDSVGEGISAEASITTAAAGSPGDKSLTVTWQPILGCPAYNVYVGTVTGVANAKYYATVGGNSVIITEVPATGNRPNAADKTGNPDDYDGLYKLSAQGYQLDLGGASLSGDNTTGVEEIDVLFKAWWDTHRLSPDLLLVHSTERKAINQVVMGSQTPVVRVDGTFGDSQINAGMAVKSVLNPYMNKDVTILTHPNAVPGTILALTQNLGENYPNARIGSNLEMRLGYDYRRIEFARSKRADEFGVDVFGALINQAPFAIGAITGIGPYVKPVTP
jgi:hypothetical protein